MEDVVAIKITDANAGSAAVITWGRLLDPISGEVLIGEVKKHLGRFGLHNIVDIKLCDSLSEVSHHKYFYEGLLAFAERPSFGDNYDAWRKEKAARIRSGKEIYFLGFDGPGGGLSPGN